MAQQPIYDAEGEHLLMSRLWAPTIADDPEAFVLFAFPWGQPNTPLGPSSKARAPGSARYCERLPPTSRTTEVSWTWTPCAKRSRLAEGKCDNPSCVNPYHLLVGTPKENTQDMIRKGRKKTVAPLGESNGKSLLDAEKVRLIRSSTLNNTALGKQLGVSSNCVRGVRTGRTWSHIEKL
jgi:hypothetical protein